jgi:hypothetical protein
MKDLNMKCSICRSNSSYYLSKELLNKYTVKYFRCSNCHFIEAEKPRYWGKEAYSSAIIDEDTGIIGRNIILSKISTIIYIIFFGKKNSKILDYAGGYGLMTRLLRDIGLDCYWQDKFADNIFAKQFVGKNKSKYGMVTAFEYFEHIDNPIIEIEYIFKKYSPNILLFSTTVHDGSPQKDWWYFAASGGQHISLYSLESLHTLASKLNLKLSTNGRNVHIFSKTKIPTLIMKIITVLSPIISYIFPLIFNSKTYSDHLSQSK